MWRKQKMAIGSLKNKRSFDGETIEEKVYRVTVNKEPIKDGAPRIYTDRKDGVLPAYDIRTDRFEHALDAMDSVSKSKAARREKSLGEKAKEGMAKEKKDETGGQSAAGTNPDKKD